jgi:cytochrome-b5 reductase
LVLITASQQCRRYATEQSSGGSNTLLYAGVATLLAGGGYYYYSQGDNASKVKNAAKEAEDKAKDSLGQAKLAGKPAFVGGDQGFISLKLDSIENINHNTKKFRFALPEGDQVSGLQIASALLTKYKGPQMEKPAIRPYTPVSDEGNIRIPTYIGILADTTLRGEGVFGPAG